MSIVKSLLSYLLLAFIILNGCSDEADHPLVLPISVSPNEAPVGKMVTITGVDFSLKPSENVVEFNGVRAPVSSSTNTSILVNVPKGATTGRVTVTTNGNSKVTSAVDFVVADCSDCGTIEKFALSNNYNYSIEPINGTKLMYDNTKATRRGFNFSVDKKIRLKSLGGLFRKKGSYPMELRAWYGGGSAIYTTTITVNDTENFVYKDVDSDIQLVPGVEYVLRYCSENHDSVYDLSPPSPGAALLQPVDFGVINLSVINYEYMTDCATVGSISGWANFVVFMRGIVDFKYEIIE